MAGCQVSLLEFHLDLVGQQQEAHGVRDRGPALADPGRHSILCQAKFIEEGPVGASLFEGRELGALDVFDDGENEAVVLCRLLDEGRDRRDSHGARCAQAPLPRDQLVASIFERADEYRLEDAVGTDGFGEFRDRFGIEVRARLTRIRDDRIDRDLPAEAACSRLSAGSRATLGRLRLRPWWCRRNEGPDSLAERLPHPDLLLVACR